jgi:peptide chain release factor 1
MNDAESIKKEYDSILQQLSDPELISNNEKMDELMEKKNELETIVEKQNSLAEVKKQIEENKTISNPEDDPELASLALTEIDQLQMKEKDLEEEIERLIKELNNSSMAGGRRGDAVIIEIRAGAGGEEAALFAAELHKMYSKYAFSKGWVAKDLDAHATDIGGFKEVVFEIKPVGKNKKDDVFSFLKYEGGVHRVQRNPKTEKSGRIHTSTATVAVLAKPKPTEISMKPSDLKISFFKSSGPGGQYVNKTESAVRIIHVPTGIVVSSQSERNQVKNKDNAMAILSARVLERKEQEEMSKASGNRNLQIGAAMRAEKIRTYNFPQDRVTDHRIKKSWHSIEKIMEGELDKMIGDLSKLEIQG